MNSRGDRLGRALAAWVTVILRSPWMVVLIAVAAVLICGRYAAGNLGINTDTANMISPTLPWRQDFIAYRESFPARDRNIVVVVDGPDPAVATEVAAALAGMLESQPEHFASVFLAGYGPFFEQNGLLYLSVAELESLSDRLVAAQPLLGRLQRDFSGAAVVDLAARIAGPEASGFDSDTASPFVEQLTLAVAAAADGRADPMDWGALVGGAALSAQPRQLLLIRPVLDFERVRPARTAIDAIREAAAEIESRFGPEISVRLTGTVAMEHEELDSVTRGASAAGIAALVLVVIVLLWALKSIVLLCLALVSLLAGLVVTAAFAALAVGHLNLISVAFAVLYVGLGVDFILHFSLRFKELLARGLDNTAALIESARGVGASLVICAVTTAAGFFAFVPTDFDGVSELGLISGGGMFVSLLVSLTLLPALLAVFGSVIRVHAGASPAVTPPPLGGARRARVILVAAATVLLLCLPALAWLQFDSNPIHLRDPDAESIRALNDLAASSDAPVFSMAAIADSPQTAQAWRTALADDPLVSRVITAADLVPLAQDDKLFVLEDLQFVLGEDLGTLAAAPFDPRVLVSSLTELQGSLSSASSAGDSPPELGDLAAAVATFLESGPDDDVLGLLDAALRSTLAEELAALERQLEATTFGLGDLPAALAERWVDASGRQLVEFVPAEDLNDNLAAAAFVATIHEVVPRATGLPVVYQEASRTIVRAFGQALSYALVMVTLLLIVLLRRFSDTVLVLIPIVFAAVVTAGSAAWLGLPFNFANIIALPLLIGVGVDNGIHMVHRLGHEHGDAGSPHATSTSKAVLASGLTTIASFGNLAYSEHQGMATMGQLLTIGMIITLVATLLVLPALYALRPAR